MFSFLQKMQDDIITAFMLMTRLPIPLKTASDTIPNVKRCVWVFPIVGLVVSSLASVIWQLSEFLALPDDVGVILTVTSMLLITGAFHEDGLADVADGFGGGNKRERKLEIMRDSALGVYGTLSLIVVMALKVSALITLSQTQLIPVLLITATASRSMIVVMAYLLPPARTNSIATEMGKPSVLSMVVTFLIAGGVTVFLADFYVTGVLFVIALTTVLLFRGLVKSQIQGFTGDVLGATQQISEIALLLALSVLWGHG